MSFDWSHFNDVARELIELKDSLTDYEARWRTAIGRSYYAAFGEAYQHLVNEGVMRREKHDDVHEKVRTTFDRQPQPESQRVGRYLNKLRVLRNIADYDPVPPYDDDVTFDEFAAQDCLDLASTVLRIIPKLPRFL